MVKIKICGITNLEDAQRAVSFGADALGFILADSPRNVKPETVKSIIGNLKGDVLKVGVFVNEPVEEMMRTAGSLGLDAIQLHGDEDSECCSKLKGWQVIKAFRIKDDSSLTLMPRYKDAFAFLLDTFTDTAYGGTGRTFDWNLAIKAKAFGKPVILSGGLGIVNIEEAIKIVRPYGVDISSSIEIRPGKKDSKLMERVIGIIKALDS